MLVSEWAIHSRLIFSKACDHLRRRTHHFQRSLNISESQIHTHHPSIQSFRVFLEMGFVWDAYHKSCSLTSWHAGKSRAFILLWLNTVVLSREHLQDWALRAIYMNREIKKPKPTQRGSESSPNQVFYCSCHNEYLCQQSLVLQHALHQIYQPDRSLGWERTFLFVCRHLGTGTD